MMTYNENIDYKKEFAKTVKEIKRNKPKLSREEKELLKFREQLKTSILEKGLLNKITLTNYGILDGEDRFKTLQELKLIEVPVLTNDLYTKQFADKYPEYFTWKEVKDYKEFKELRVISSLSRKLRRKEIEDYCKLIDGTMSNEQIGNYVIEKFKKYIPERTLYRWIPQQYKRAKLPSGNYLLEKPDTITTSIRLPKPLFEKYKEKYDGNINFRLKWLIEKDLELDLVDKEDIKNFLESNKPQQPQEIKQTIQQAQEILENNQEDKNVDYKPSKFDFCKVCNRTTRHVWNSFTQEYMCGECYAKEINKVGKQTPARIEIRKVGE
jgi:hypothetical protein